LAEQPISRMDQMAEWPDGRMVILQKYKIDIFSRNNYSQLSTGFA
jgi:hypothetical protein